MQIQPQIIPDSNHPPRILIWGSIRPLHTSYTCGYSAREFSQSYNDDWELSLWLPWTQNSWCIMHYVFQCLVYDDKPSLHELRFCQQMAEITANWMSFTRSDYSLSQVRMRANLDESKECYRNNKLISLPLHWEYAGAEEMRLSELSADLSYITGVPSANST